jgi:hypothetical protein
MVQEAQERALHEEEIRMREEEAKRDKVQDAPPVE